MLDILSPRGKVKQSRKQENLSCNPSSGNKDDQRVIKLQTRVSKGSSYHRRKTHTDAHIYAKETHKHTCTHGDTHTETHTHAHTRACIHTRIHKDTHVDTCGVHESMYAPTP